MDLQAMDHEAMAKQFLQLGGNTACSGTFADSAFRSWSYRDMSGREANDLLERENKFRIEMPSNWIRG